LTVEQAQTGAGIDDDGAERPIDLMGNGGCKRDVRELGLRLAQCLLRLLAAYLGGDIARYAAVA
jgi:hypothetical protein